jgi:acyl dehydratase
MAMTKAEITAGADLIPFTKTIQQHQINLFETWGSEPSAGDGGNYHTDKDLAKEALGGFEKPMASGRMSNEYVLQALSQWFGRESVASSARVDLRYLVPVVAGDQLMVKGTVVYVRERDSVSTVNTEVWIENQKAQKVSVGTASVTIS